VKKEEAENFCKKEDMRYYEVSALKKLNINKLLFNSIIELPQFEQYIPIRDQIVEELGKSILLICILLENENKGETASVFKSEKQLEVVCAKGEFTLQSGRDTPTPDSKDIKDKINPKQCKCWENTLYIIYYRHVFY